MIVDDDPFISDLLTRKFSDEGFITRHAGSGEDALKNFETEKLPDAVLLDIMLPGIDGFEVLRRMKADARIATVPVVVLSNIGNEEDMEKAKHLGALLYLVKISVPLEEIVEKVRSVCPKR